MKTYSFSRQKGVKNHCFMAQIWKNGVALCNISSTDDPKEATATAELITNLLNKNFETKKHMKNLSKRQKEFILDRFFTTSKYVGWKNIAESLLADGECIVAGEKCIWVGGVGNFIKTEIADNLFGCLKYTFDLEWFLTSEYFREIIGGHLLELNDTKDSIEITILDLKSLL